jgi:hypothetical protein
VPARTPTLEEIAHWSIDDINAQVLGLLPKGVKFDLETHPDRWRVSFKQEADGRELWFHEHWDMRTLMLSAFAWLWQQQNPTRVHPAWVPRAPRILRPIHPGVGIPNPEDLDPAHIQSVYDGYARKRGKE